MEMMMTNTERDFRKHQSQERLLSGLLVACSVLAPVSFTWLSQKEFYWIISVGTALSFVMAALIVQLLRQFLSQKLENHYENLNVGAVLEKKIGPSNRNRFVITHCGYNHYYVTSLKSGERVLVSKHRVREEFDIAH